MGNTIKSSIILKGQRQTYTMTEVLEGLSVHNPIIERVVFAPGSHFYECLNKMVNYRGGRHNKSLVYRDIHTANGLLSELILQGKFNPEVLASIRTNFYVWGSAVASHFLRDIVRSKAMREFIQGFDSLEDPIPGNMHLTLGDRIEEEVPDEDIPKYKLLEASYRFAMQSGMKPWMKIIVLETLEGKKKKDIMPLFECLWNEGHDHHPFISEKQKNTCYNNCYDRAKHWMAKHRSEIMEIVKDF